jgi:ribosomal protein L35
MKYKTKKALTKRFKITKNGKIMRRPAGQNHFLAKKSGGQTRDRRGNKKFGFMASTLKKRI